MILLRERVQNPIYNNREECIKCWDEAKPPRDDETPAGTLGYTHYASCKICRTHAHINEIVSPLTTARSLEVTAKLGRRRAGIDARDFDAKRINLAPECVSKGAHARLAGGICGNKRRRDQTCNRAHVDNVALTARQHMWKHRMCHKHGADQIDADHCLNVAFRLELLEPVHTSKTGVVKEDIYALIKVKSTLHHQVNVGAFVQVDRYGKRLTAFILNIRRERLQLFEPTCGQHYFTSLLCEKTRGVLTESR